MAVVNPSHHPRPRITMHYLHSGKALVAFRFGALATLLFAANFAATLILGPVSLVTHDPKLLRWTLYVLGGLPFTGLLYMFFAVRARCPLCMNPPLVTRACQKHRTARTLVGSYRLRVATAVTLTGGFHCPYCGERTRCVVRDHRH